MPDGEFYKCGEVIDAQLLHQVAPKSHSQLSRVNLIL